MPAPKDPTATAPQLIEGSEASDHIFGPTIRDRILGFRRVKAHELLEHPKRWREHPEPQRSVLREHLERIGYADALLAREGPEGLVLIDGHLRKELTPEQDVPVLVLDLTEEEAEQLLVSLDPLAQMAIADEEALASLLEGVTVPEALLEELHLRYLRELKGISNDPDEIPPKHTEGRVRPGELWALGPHRLLCADATVPEHLQRVLHGERADLLLTDPPYGVDYEGKTTERLRIRNDGPAGLQALLREAFAAANAVLKPGAGLYVFHPAGPGSLGFAHAFEEAGWSLRQTLVWVKDRMVLGHGDYHYRHEPILYGYAPGAKARGRGRAGWYGGNDQDSVLEVDRPAASKDHPTAKPVELIRILMQNSSRVGARVLDPFGGSGTTLVAAHELRRRAYLVEIDPVYADVILRRFEALTGEEAVREDG
jgi:DNA modification methylase